MGTTLAAVHAQCLLCGSAVLSVGAGGRIESEDLHPIVVPEAGRGYMLCDECGVLADTPTDLTLN